MKSLLGSFCLRTMQMVQRKAYTMDSECAAEFLLHHVILTALETYNLETCCEDNTSSQSLWEQTNTHCLLVFPLKTQDTYDSSNATTITCNSLRCGKLGFSFFLR